MALTLWTEGIYQNRAQQNITNTLPVDANFKINIHANYQVLPELALYVRGENLTNNTSQMMFSYNQTGAMVFGGISLKLW
jgi:outer membrane cobalamin receptor